MIDKKGFCGHPTYCLCCCQCRRCLGPYPCTSLAAGRCHATGMPSPSPPHPTSPESALTFAVNKDHHSRCQQRPLPLTTTTAIFATTIDHCRRTSKSKMKTIADNTIALSWLLTAAAKMPSPLLPSTAAAASNDSRCCHSDGNSSGVALLLCHWHQHGAALPATQAVLHCHCVAVVVVALATQLSSCLRPHSPNNGANDNKHRNKGGRHDNIHSREEGDTTTPSAIMTHQQ